MRKSILTALAGMAAFSATAFAQATLETLMTHGVSSAVGTHAGTVLGRATNAMANRVAQQTPSAASHATSAYTPKRAGIAKARTTQATTPVPAAPATASGNGSLIASIQGGEPRTRNCTPSAKAGDTKIVTGSQSACAPVARQAADHPSVVNLPAPQ